VDTLEALTARQAVALARDLWLNNHVFQGDSSTIVNSPCGDTIILASYRIGGLGRTIKVHIFVVCNTKRRSKKY
jgi:hypothetical protein